VVRAGPWVSQKDLHKLQTELSGRVDEALGCHRMWPRRAKSHPRLVIAGGRISDALAEEADAADAELVVMGRKGHRLLKKLLLGATTEQLARPGRYSILVTGSAAVRRYAHPLVAVDFSEASQWAVDCAQRLAPKASHLSVVHSYDRSYAMVMRAGAAATSRSNAMDRKQRSFALEAMEQFVARTRAGLPLQPLVVGGDARIALNNVAQKQGSDVLVLGAHGEGEHVGLGSVADAMIRVADIDVCIAARPPVL
jgi:nucleotide-binding universal stress UspA family protein